MAASRRILLTRAMAGAEAVVPPCPVGEQITNDGFEIGTPCTDNIENWSTWYGHVVTTPVHSGSQAIEFNVNGEWVEQDIESLKGYVIPVHCIQQFYFWALGYTAGAVMQGIITYSDDSTTVAEFVATESWLKCDLKPHLVAGKSVSKIKIEMDRLGTMSYIDDVSLVSGD